MSLEPKHKNFKDKYKIKELVYKIFNIRRHMYILVAFDTVPLSMDAQCTYCTYI
jgi:hypothetical protein